MKNSFIPLTNTVLVLCAVLCSLSESVTAQLTWTKRPISGSGWEQFDDAIFANNKFHLSSRVYTTGYMTAGNSFSSVTGQTWQGSPANQLIVKPAFGKGLFIGMRNPQFYYNGNVSKIYSSSNLISWSPVFTLPNDNYFSSSNAVFNGVGFALLSCPDRFFKSDGLGKMWTTMSATLPPEVSTYESPSLAFGAGVYVAAVRSDSGKYWIISSTDGSAWTIRYTGNGGDNAPSRVRFANGLFVAVCGAGRIITSQDGLSWTLRSLGGYPLFTDVAFGKNTWVLVGSCGAIWTSIDNGGNWTQNITGTFATFHTVTFGNNTFLAAGDAVIYQSN